MRVEVITDPTWGDNAKGKVVDILAGDADANVRFNGGPNAGHTVKNELGKFVLHGLPSSVLHREVMSIIPFTSVVNPKSIQKEVEELRDRGVTVGPDNLLISPDAPLIMPWHERRDKLREVSRSGGGIKIGTTGRGIGPAYADHTDRTGLRIRDLFDKDFINIFDQELRFQERNTRVMNNEVLLSELMQEKNLLKIYRALREARRASKKMEYDRDRIIAELQEAREVLEPMVGEVLPVLNRLQEQNKHILGEAGQGGLLDLDWGGYPYVTSSHPGVAGFTLATGIDGNRIDRVIGAQKAYFTRVGEGPMPTELFDNVGDEIREKGGEFGATTLRPRRVGWMDIPALKYGIKSVGARELALTKLDILSGLGSLQICIGYEVGGKVYRDLDSANPRFMLQAKPILREVKGWDEDISQIRAFDNLPTNAKEYIRTVEEEAGTPINMVGVGPGSDETIFRI